MQNDFPIVVADEAAEPRKRRPVYRIASFPGLHFRGRALVPIRLFPPLFENFVVGPNQRLTAEQVVNARESRRQRQMMLGWMEIAGKNDEEPASSLQDAVALSQRMAHVLHVLENVVGQYGVEAIVLEWQILPYRHAIIGGDFLQGGKLPRGIDEFLLDVDARQRTEPVSFEPGRASPAREATQVESAFTQQERGQVLSEIVIPGIGQLVPVLALGGREHDRLALRLGPFDENRVP